MQEHIRKVGMAVQTTQTAAPIYARQTERPVWAMPRPVKTRTPEPMMTPTEMKNKSQKPRVRS